MTWLKPKGKVACWISHKHPEDLTIPKQCYGRFLLIQPCIHFLYCLGQQDIYIWNYNILFDLDIKILQRSKASAKNRQDSYIAHNSRLLYYWHLSVETGLNWNLRSAHHTKKKQTKSWISVLGLRGLPGMFLVLLVLECLVPFTLQEK